VPLSPCSVGVLRVFQQNRGASRHQCAAAISASAKPVPACYDYTSQRFEVLTMRGLQLPAHSDRTALLPILASRPRARQPLKFRSSVLREAFSRFVDRSGEARIGPSIVLALKPGLATERPMHRRVLSVDQANAAPCARYSQKPWTPETDDVSKWQCRIAKCPPGNRTCLRQCPRPHPSRPAAPHPLRSPHVFLSCLGLCVAPNTLFDRSAITVGQLPGCWSLPMVTLPRGATVRPRYRPVGK